MLCGDVTVLVDVTVLQPAPTGLDDIRSVGVKPHISNAASAVGNRIPTCFDVDARDLISSHRGQDELGS